MSGMKVNPSAFLQNTWLLFLNFFFLIRYLKRLSVHNHFKYVLTKTKELLELLQNCFFPFKLVRL